MKNHLCIFSVRFVHFYFAKNKREIQETDNQIDAIVFDLYSLDEGEVEMVLDSVETPEDEKSDILAKFREISTT